MSQYPIMITAAPFKLEAPIRGKTELKGGMKTGRNWLLNRFTFITVNDKYRKCQYMDF